MRRWLLAMVTLLWAQVALAAMIEATVDRTSVTLQDRVRLTVTVQANHIKPSLPDLSAFDVYDAGASNQVTIINGRQTLSTGFTYVLVPRTKGSFTIGPVSVMVGGQRYSTRPFQLTVSDAPKAPAAGGEAYITATVSNKQPYIGEPIIYVFRLYSRVQVNGGQLSLPDFDGFSVEDLGEQRDYESVVGGQRYKVTEIRKALVPQDEGSFTLDAASLQVNVLVRSQRVRGSLFDDFFSRGFGGYQQDTRVLHSRPIEVEVRKLPRAPQGFSGLVGKFTLQAELSRTTLPVGGSTTLTTTIRGSGNVRAIPAPRYQGLDAFKQYDEKATGTVNTKGSTLKGSKTFIKALVPTSAGPQQVGPVELIIFDTRKGGYRTLRQGPFPIEVTPSEGEQDLRLTEGLAPQGKMAVRVLGDDILPNVRRLDALHTHHELERAGVIGGLLAPPLAWLGLLGLAWRRQRDAADSGRQRRLGARKTALSALESARSASHPAGAEDASRALRVFLGDKLGREGAAFTPAEAEQLLDAHGVEAELSAALRQALDRLDEVRYGGGGDPDIDALRALVKRLDRALVGRGRRT